MAAELHEAEEALTEFLYCAPIGLLQATVDGAIDMANPMAAQLLMPITPTGDLDNLFDVLREVLPGLRHEVTTFAATSGVVCEGSRFTIDSADDLEPRVLSLTVMKLDPRRLMVSIADVTADAERERRDVSRQLRRAARIDGLTRIPNREAMLERIAAAVARQALEPQAGFAILYIGLERYSEIGDSFGPKVKDALLAVMAERLGAALRPSDCVGCAGGLDQIAARMGGDEFVVLLQELDPAVDALPVAQRLLEHMGAPYLVDEQPIHCAVSIGYARSDQVGLDGHDLLQDASIAMNEAKRAGGARVTMFDPRMRDRAVRRGGIELELRRALAGDELFVVYQPVVALREGQPPDRSAAVEALVRWQHPVRGVVPPIEFIGVAEESGLIGALGTYVLETACRQFADWQVELGDRAPRLLAVNLSRAQLGDDQLIASVRLALEASGLRPDQLQLEVTESLAAQDDAVRAQLHALKAMGVGIALDDFGTGYSSLSSLHLLPIDTVKIDRSFVTLLESSPHHCVLIEATTRVCHSLGLSIVAEGIETAHQASIIERLGCHKGQGYLYSRPLLPADLPAWLVGDAADFDDPRGHRLLAEGARD